MKLLLVLLASLILSLSSISTAMASHSWNDYHWARRSNPFTITLINNLTADWNSKLTTASADWSQSSVLDTVVGTSGGRGQREVTVTNAFYGQTGWIGIATIWIDSQTHHILSGSVQLNETYLTNDQRYATEAFRLFVICQEIGHTFGLDHQDENFGNFNLGTCMDYTSDADGGTKFGPSNEHPNAHDYAQLETIYAHSDKGKGKGPQGGPNAVESITWIIPAN